MKKDWEMNSNVGSLDRGMRLSLGAVLIVAALFSSLTLFDGAVVKYGAVIVGLVLAATGLMGTCPMYSILGIRTCKA
jgi:hypothetical protein